MKPTGNAPPKYKADISALAAFFLFLGLNFAVLFLGVLLQGEGPQSEWYANQHKAPWTPPSWVFPLAWFSIMVLFAIYMGFLSHQIGLKAVLPLYGLQWILNLSWNPLFFNLHQSGWALGVILALTLTIGVILWSFRKVVRKYNWFLFPYFIWLLLADSLNAYFVLLN